MEIRVSVTRFILFCVTSKKIIAWKVFFFRITLLLFVFHAIVQFTEYANFEKFLCRRFSALPCVVILFITLF